jgi:N-acetylmuramoyl-L-alanine amidase
VRRWLPRVLVLLVVSLAPWFSSGAQPAQITLLSREGRRAVTTTPVNGQDYLSLDELTPIFQLTVREDRLAGGVTVTGRNRSLVLTPDQSVVSVQGRLVSLAQPPVRQGNRLLVPVEFLPRALGPLLEQRMEFRRPSRLVVIGDLRVPRVIVRGEFGAQTAQVVFEITPPAAPTVTATPGQLTVQFEADAVDLTLPTLPAQGFLQALRAGDNLTSVVLATGSRFGTYRATSQPADASSTRLVLDLLALGADTAAPGPSPGPPAPAVPPAAPAAPPTGGVAIGSPTPAFRTIVIDPGHGGDELGATGPGGTVEKDITLQVARRLRTLIETRLGLRVLLTRDDDRTVPHDQRTAFANNNRADLFLSIHANAAVRPAPRGAEVYYLSVERAETEARRVAEGTSPALPQLGGGTRTIDLILWETAQARHLEQSAVLAGVVEQSLRTQVEMSPRPVQQAPFRVLVGANMPAVLVEIGYLSNPEQEQAIAGAAYQDRIAQALLDAIVRYRDSATAAAPRPPA